MEDEKSKIIGGIIVAAGKVLKTNQLYPLLKIGSITIIKRIVLTFQNAGISPIVIITGHEAEEIEHELAYYGVIFLRNKDYENSQMFDSIKIGLNFLQNKCDKLIITPATIPMFIPDTIQKLIKDNNDLILPSYNKKAGHPILIDSKLIPELLKYDGYMGMRGAFKNIGITPQYINVKDKGIVQNIEDIDQLDDLLKNYNKDMLHPFVKISIEKESVLFNSRVKLLLLLIKDTGSVRNACKHIALSYSKAWNMLNLLEKELGYEVVERKHGGSKGGKTNLTKDGVEFLDKYHEFEENVRSYARNEFKRLFENE